MVFGWRKKKSQKQKPEQFETKEEQIHLEDIPSITKNLEDLRTKTIIAETKSFRKKIEGELQSILKIIKQLEKDDLKTDDIDKHLQMLVVRGKKTVITVVKKETATKLPDIKTYKDVVGLNATTAQSLKRIGDVLGRQSRVIHIFAKKYAAKLKEHLAVLNSNRQELQNLIENYESISRSINEIESQLESYNNAKTNLDTLNQRITQLNDSVEKYRLEIDSTKEQIEKIKSSPNYTKYLETQKKLESLFNTKNQVKNQIDFQLTKISRELSKYTHVSSLDKSQNDLLSKLTSNAFEVLIPANKQDIIKILSAVRKGVEGGSVSVKDTAKSLKHIDETIEASDDLINKVNEFVNKQQTLEKELSTFNIGELKQTKDYLQKTIENKADAKSKIKKLENEKLDSKKIMQHSVTEIESLLKKISGTKYWIKTRS